MYQRFLNTFEASTNSVITGVYDNWMFVPVINFKWVLNLVKIFFIEQETNLPPLDMAA